MDTIEAAAMDITRRLIQLEKATGRTVDGIALCAIDCRSIAAIAVRRVRHVEITMSEPVVTSWAADLEHAITQEAAARMQQPSPQVIDGTGVKA